MKNKPIQGPVQLNGAHHQGGRSDPNQPLDMQFPSMPTQPKPTMPYTIYPSHPYFPTMLMQPQGWPSIPPGSQPMVPGVPHYGPNTPIKSIKGPAICDWLDHCDYLPDCEGPSFGTIAGKFKQQGYHSVNQLTSSHMTVADLSTWLDIRKKQPI